MVMILPRVFSVRVPGCVFVKGSRFLLITSLLFFSVMRDILGGKHGVFPKSSRISENKQFRVTIDVGDLP